MQKLLAKWETGKSHAIDTIDVGLTGSALAAPMATMMLGETDDSFEAAMPERASAFSAASMALRSAVFILGMS